MNYILVGKDKTTTDVTLSVSDGTTTAPTATFATVPVQQNYRTNIYGSLLTNPANFTVVIDPAFNTPDYANEVWDGTSMSAPSLNENGDAYQITNPSEFAYFLNASGVVTESTSVKSRATSVRTFNLTGNLDMGGMTLPVPAPNTLGVYQFGNVTFNGNGYTISNFKTTNAGVNTGIFPLSVGLTVSDLNVDNATVGVTNPDGDAYAGVIGGTAYGATITNVKVTNSTVNGVNKVGGILGFAAENIATITNCSVANTTINGIGEDAGCVGGILGYAGAYKEDYGSYLENCAVSNITVNVPKGEAKASRGNAYLVGTVGAKSGSQTPKVAALAINKCTVSGNNTLVSNYTAHQLVGADRFGNSGDVLVDGKAISLTADLVIANATQFLAFRDAVNEGNDYSGKTVKLVADIDLGKVEFKPIGRLVTEGWKYFSGTFDGCGHTISGLLNQTTQSNERQTTVFGRGLFGALKDATICNFTLTDSWVGGTLPISDRPGGNIVGAAVGYAYGNIVIDNVNVNNSTVVGFGKVGGLIGSYQDSTGKISITNCSVSDVDIHACQATAALHGFSCSPKTEDNVFGNCAISNVTVNLYNDARGENTLINNQWFWKYTANNYLYPMVANWYTTLDNHTAADGTLFYGNSYDTLDGCTGNITINVNWK
jgi:hypothetical protein